MLKLFVLSGILVGSSFVCLASNRNPPQTVEHVDLNRYLGAWYEIASIPQFFSKGCHCTRAVYSPGKKPNKISVFNTCNSNSVKGKISKILGVAKIKDKESNAKLSVTFFWPFSGSYWIIGLAEDYRYAVVSNKKGSTLWILSRTPNINADDLKDALAIATKNGIDVNRLKYTEQNGCQYPEIK
jgi:apolipoprotein D and lipocalin family protein